MRENRLSDSIKAVMDNLNVISGSRKNADVVIDAFGTSHRTLQQCFVWLVILPILQHLGDNYNNGIYDGRNEASCRLAAKILAALSEDDTYLPFI